MDINFTVAQNIRTIREEKKLTLDGAARITGVSRSMLTQIEKGDVNPTISMLWKIANGFKVPVTSLLKKSQVPSTLLRVEDLNPIVEDQGKYINYPGFHFDDERPFETYRIVIAPQGKLQANPHLRGTEEYITVFSGAVEIIAGSEFFSLKQGDSVRFKADINHQYENIGTTEAQLSMIIYYSK